MRDVELVVLSPHTTILTDCLTTQNNIHLTSGTGTSITASVNYRPKAVQQLCFIVSNFFILRKPIRVNLKLKNLKIINTKTHSYGNFE